MTEALVVLVYGIPLALIVIGYVIWQHRASQKNLQIFSEATSAGLGEPVSLHPTINASLCIGCGACVNACPEANVLGLIRGKSQLINPNHCIGHGACQKACPVDAITLVFGSATRGVDIPLVSPEFESSVPGIYIAGELGGMGLIRNAIEQGRQAMEAIIKAMPASHTPLDTDVLIVGAGPAGIAASLAAKKAGISYLTIDQESTLGGTVAHFPRGKLVMTQPAYLPLVGKLKFKETSKENLLACWQQILTDHPLNLRFGERLQSIEHNTGVFTVTTQQHQYRCQRLLLAIGRRGSPRQLGIPGENLSKVVYRLVDPEQYRGKKVLVVGGGDSALEAAISIADQPGANVTLTYRGDAFKRAKSKNRERIESFSETNKIILKLQTSPVAITEKTVELEENGQRYTIKNDIVIVCAGGELPTALLKSIGVQVETKYGTA